MIRCPACSSRVPAESRYCGDCGAAVGATETSVPTSTPARPGPDSDSGSSFPSFDEARFLPGTMLAGRYRIVGLLGRGGMGEVYRADDLKLGQPVALKFLPEALERDPHRLSRFLNEVRVSLRVSHPNVCRVHDIGEVDGHHYLSMEYVDGEDLASLLRRIGRFPPDRAARAARQLCAGLAAAHDQGILHRDLKPANVMIDGRGQVKITDFGLAGLAEEIRGTEVRAGTPAYMAPEQLEGKEVTIRSDIFALGLVLYEIFTGKPAFDGSTPSELLRLQRETSPTSPSTLVDGIDPAVERVILRCLDRDATSRPSSPLAIAAALPGGDPLAAALAAGETPSPELVAEAGQSGGLTSVAAGYLLALFVAGAAFMVWSSPETLVASMVSLDRSPAVLEEKAREIVDRAGYDQAPMDRLYAFVANGTYIRHLERLPPAPGRWTVLRNDEPPGVLFFYRQSPRRLVAFSDGSLGDWLGDPPPTFPGMIEVGLDLRGRLRSFHAVPPEHDVSESEAAGFDWTAMFEAAGLDAGSFSVVTPEWSPPSYAERRSAWAGVYPEAPDIDIRVEAAELRGKPVYFRVVEPWATPAGSPPRERSFWAKAGDFVESGWFLVVVIGATVVAIRNLRLGRGDRRTAFRFALYLGIVRFLWLLGEHHVVGESEINLLRAHLAWALFRVGLVYVFYLALEPYARRLWPRTLVSWVRVFQGRFRDSRVGADLLVGVAFGATQAFLIRMVGWAPELLGLESYGPDNPFWSLEALRGFRQSLAALAGNHTLAVLNVFVAIMFFLVARVFLRRTWIAVAAFSVLTLVIFNPATGNPVPYLIGAGIVIGLFWVVFFRSGLLAVVVAASVSDLLRNTPLTFEIARWYGTPTLLTLAVLGGLAAWAFWTSLGGRPLLRDEILEAEAAAD